MPRSAAPAAALLLALALTGPAQAALPAQLRGMLDAAIAGGNPGEIEVLAKYLKQASPADATEVDQAIAAHRARVEAARIERLTNQKLTEGWKGEGQLGASHNTGNSSSVGLSAGINLNKEELHWRHHLRLLVDYQRTNGVTSRNQWLASWEPNFKFSDRLYASGLAQFERDRFAGFSQRITLSGGLGYKLIASPALTIDVKGGPAWRRTDNLGQGPTSSLTALGGLAAAWRIAPGLTLTQDESALYASDNTNISSVSALTAKLTGKLSARMSVQETTNTNPPAGFRHTDTLSRMTLVYGF